MNEKFLICSTAGPGLLQRTKENKQIKTGADRVLLKLSFSSKVNAFFSVSLTIL